MIHFKRYLILFVCLFALIACDKASNILGPEVKQSKSKKKGGLFGGLQSYEKPSPSKSPPKKAGLFGRLKSFEKPSPPTLPTLPTPPAEDPPAEDPPAEDPPAEDPPAEDPPAEDPPVEDPPAEDPPVVDPPVADTTPPVISLIGESELTIEAYRDPDGLPFYIDAGATALDNIDGDISGEIITTGSVDGRTPGTYTLRYNVTDKAGNPAEEVTRIVEVEDKTPPVLTMKGDAEITVPIGSVYVDPGVTAFDNLDWDITDRIITSGSVDNRTLGTYTLRYNVTDIAENPAEEITRIVIVEAGPIAVMPVGLSEYRQVLWHKFDSGKSAQEFNQYLEGNNPWRGWRGLEKILNHNDRTLIIWVDGDSSQSVKLTFDNEEWANVAAAIQRLRSRERGVGITFDITIENVSAQRIDGLAGAFRIDYFDNTIAPPVVDPPVVDPPVVDPPVVDPPVVDPPVVDPPVADTTPPVISLIGESELTIEAYRDPDGLPSYIDAGATALDNIDGDISGEIITTGSVDGRTPGTYTLRYNVTDKAGNPAEEVTRIVEVEDKTPPVLTRIGDAVIAVPLGVEYVDAGVTAYDNLDWDITEDIVMYGSVRIMRTGKYILHFTVADAAGNTAEPIQRYVTVVETDVPPASLNEYQALLWWKYSQQARDDSTWFSRYLVENNPHTSWSGKLLMANDERPGGRDYYLIIAFEGNESEKVRLRVPQGGLFDNFIAAISALDTCGDTVGFVKQYACHNITINFDITVLSIGGIGIHGDAVNNLNIAKGGES